MRGNRVKLQKPTNNIFHIIREIRGGDVSINQKQDALIQEPSKNKKEELLEVKNRTVKKKEKKKRVGR